MKLINVIVIVFLLTALVGVYFYLDEQGKYVTIEDLNQEDQVSSVKEDNQSYLEYQPTNAEYVRYELMEDFNDWYRKQFSME